MRDLNTSLRLWKCDNFARVAFIPACAAGSAIARVNPVPARIAGPQPSVSVNNAANIPMIKYHSGMRVMDHRVLEDPQRYWKGAVPQTPWYTRPPIDGRSTAMPLP